MATMDKIAREAILNNALMNKVKQANGEICRFDCSIGGAIILGRWMDGKPFFWVEGDDIGTYEVKGKRFFNVSGDVVRSPFYGAPSRGVSSVMGAKSEAKEPETNKQAESKKEDSDMATATATKTAPAKQAKTIVIKKGGDMNTHLGYNGEKEEVPAATYTNKFTCKCGNIRWIKNADVFQVKMCKPCVKVARMKNIAKLRKAKTEKAKANKPTVKESKAPAKAPKAKETKKATKTKKC